jgi:hypothetical protein|tara:strand:- start:48 stop:314 length:267 start_codon:yes stop_codon:yes gene_type:complete
MQSNARRALKIRSALPRSQKGMTPVGLARANQFAKGENVSIKTVKRTYSYLSRAKAYYKPGSKTAGTQAYLGWGGDAGLRWARKILGK